MRQTQTRMIGLAGIAVVVVAVIGFSVWAVGEEEIPRSDADPITIARFLGTPRWEKLSEDQKRPYMSTLRKNADAISQALEDNKISKEQHDLAKHNIWLERQLDKMEDYYKLPPGEPRVKYLDELVQSKIQKRKNPKPRNPNDPDTDEDSPFMKQRKEQWPQQMEDRWDDYHDALEAREKLRGL